MMTWVAVGLKSCTGLQASGTHSHVRPEGTPSLQPITHHQRCTHPNAASKDATDVFRSADPTALMSIHGRLAACKEDHWSIGDAHRALWLARGHSCSALRQDWQAVPLGL